MMMDGLLNPLGGEMSPHLDPWNEPTPKHEAGPPLEDPNKYNIDDDDITGVARALYILGKSGNSSRQAGYRVQVLGIIDRLLELHAEAAKITEMEVIDMLVTCLQSFPASIHGYTAAKACEKVCHELSGYPRAGSIAPRLFDLGVAMIDTLSKPDHERDQDAWLSVLEQTLPFVSNTDAAALQGVVEFLMARTVVTEPARVRAKCASLASVTVTRLTEESTPKSAEPLLSGVIKVMQRLSRDFESEVRSTVAKTWLYWASTVEPEIQHEDALPILQALCQDDDPEVAQLAVHQGALAAHKVKDGIGKDTLDICFPVFQGLMKTAQDHRVCPQAPSAKRSKSDPTLRLAEMMGPCLFYGHSRLSDTQLVACFELIRILASSTSPAVRLALAQNIPALARVATSPGGCVEKDELCDAILDGCVMIAAAGDTDSLCMLAAGLHETCHCCISVGMPSKGYVVLTTLLRHSESKVVFAGLEAVERCMSILGMRNKSFGEDQAPLKLLSSLTSISLKDWRLRARLLTLTQNLGLVFDSRQLFGPLMILYASVLTERSAPLSVLSVAIESTCKLVRNTKRREQRDHAITWSIEELARAPTSFHQLLFIDLCKCCISTYSRDFFKSNFFEALMELAAASKINEVRLRILKIIPEIKKSLVLPADRPRLKQLEEFVTNCVAERASVISIHSIAEHVARDLSETNALYSDTTNPTYADKEDALKVKAEKRDFAGKSRRIEIKPSMHTAAATVLGAKRWQQHSGSLRAGDQNQDDGSECAKKNLPKLPGTHANNRINDNLMPSRKSVTSNNVPSPRPVRRINAARKAPADELMKGIRKSRSSYYESASRHESLAGGRMRRTRRRSLIESRLGGVSTSLEDLRNIDDSNGDSNSGGSAEDITEPRRSSSDLNRRISARRSHLDIDDNLHLSKLRLGSRSLSNSIEDLSTLESQSTRTKLKKASSVPREIPLNQTFSGKPKPPSGRKKPNLSIATGRPRSSGTRDGSRSPVSPMSPMSPTLRARSRLSSGSSYTDGERLASPLPPIRNGRANSPRSFMRSVDGTETVSRLSTSRRSDR